MVRAAAEDKALRADTAAFIASAPYPVSLVRTERISDGAGGWLDDTEVTLNPQVVKLQPNSGRGLSSAGSAAGEVPVFGIHVIGMPDLDVQANDRFTFDGRQWRIVFVDSTVSYRTLAEVELDGS